MQILLFLFWVLQIESLWQSCIQKVYQDIFLTAFVYLMSFCHVLVILMFFFNCYIYLLRFLWWLSGKKNLPANAGDRVSIPGLERSPGEGNGNPLQDSCLGNMDRRNLAGFSPWGRKRVRHDSETKQQHVFVIYFSLLLYVLLLYVFVICII